MASNNSKVLPDQLMNSVLGKLYDTLTMGDENVPRSSNDFFSWCTPGIPYEEDQFDFLSQGFTAMIRKGDSDKLPEGMTLEQKMGQQTAELYLEAENLARLVDFIPSVSGVENGKRRQNIMTKIWSPDGTLSGVYEYVLRMSQVVQTELDVRTKAKIEKLRGLLVEKKRKTDLITDEIIEVTEPSELVKKYYEKMYAYEDAVLEYNARQISAKTASTPEAVHYFAQNASTLRNRVKAAYADWVANGFKEDFERISAYLDQVMSRDLTLLKAEFKDDLKKAMLTGISSGSDFYYTSLLPGNFARAKGWTEFTFSQNDFATHYEKDKKQWGASAGFLGVFGASTGSSRTEITSQINWNSFGLHFELAQVPIVRPWLHTEFLKSHYWRFHPDAKKTGQGDILSDGKIPPKGKLVAYPTAIIFARNLRLTFTTSSGKYQSLEESFKSSGGLSIGPFFAGGKYKSGHYERDSRYKFTGQGIEAPGMQIIGFRCHLQPLSPDAVKGIPEGQWV